MSHSATPVLAVPPIERFLRIIDGLCAAIAARGPGGGLPAPLLVLLWSRLRRIATRATKLAACLAAGLPLAPIRPRPAVPRPSRPEPLRLPRGYAWLVRVVPGTAGYAAQLQALLDDPLMAPLADAPSLRRMLNPLRRMLGIRRPPPPPSPRPPAAVPPSPRPAQGGGGPAAHAPPPAARRFAASRMTAAAGHAHDVPYKKR